MKKSIPVVANFLVVPGKLPELHLTSRLQRSVPLKETAALVGGLTLWHHIAAEAPPFPKPHLPKAATPNLQEFSKLGLATLVLHDTQTEPLPEN